MKLSLAVALLGQTVPTLSKRYHPVVQRDDGASSLTSNTEEIIKKGGGGSNSSPQSIFDQGDERQSMRRNRRVKRNLARTMKNSPSFLNALVPCDPKSTTADVGILSCGEDHVCQPSNMSSQGGLCTPLESNHQAHKHGHHSILPWKESLPLANLHPQGTDLEECDPTLVDVGILVCGEGRHCQHDEMSGLGGFCLDSLNDDRRLQSYTDLDYYTYYCGAYPPEAPIQFCDCSGINMDTGTGTMTCTQDTIAQGVQGCEAYTVYNVFSYSFENSALVNINDCYETKTPVAEKICFTYDLANPSGCSTDWNGQQCASCATSAYSTSFDCSNVGGRVGDYWIERLSVFDNCRISTCTNVCSAGLYIPEANMATSVTVGYYLMTCRVIALSEENKLISDVDCAAYSQAAQASCCAPALAAATAAPTVATVPATPAPVVPATPAPVVPATPAPVLPAPVVPATPAPTVATVAAPPAPVPVPATPAPTFATVVTPPAPVPVPATPSPTVATVAAPPDPLPAAPAPVSETAAPTVESIPEDSGKEGSKKTKKEKDNGDDSKGSDMDEPKKTKSDGKRLRA